MLFAGGGKPRRRMRKVESGIPFAEPAPIGYVYEPWKDCHYSGDNNPPSYRPEVPKLTKPGWRSVPPIEKLHKMTDAQLSCVAKFAVIRDGYVEGTLLLLVLLLVLCPLSCCCCCCCCC
jgi:hypothetical protein